MGRTKQKKKRERQDKKRRKAEREGPSLARKADRYKLYQESVQDPESDVKLMQRIFKKRYGRPARLLREDFCGSAALACEWVSAHPDNRAWGIDLDPEPLAWAQANNLALLSPDQRERVHLIEGDVLEAQTEPADITVAYNFSYFCFQTRRDLLGYLRTARSTLREEGLLILDAYGGADAQQTMTETRDQEGFDYVWDQDAFDPIRHHAINHIHFEFPDGSRIQKAFSYDWRLWTLPELCDLLEDAGFAKSEVYWEGTDAKSGEGNGVYRKAEQAPDDPAWIAYIVGVR